MYLGEDKKEKRKLIKNATNTKENNKKWKAMEDLNI